MVARQDMDSIYKVGRQEAAVSQFWQGYLWGVSQNFVASIIVGVPAFLHLHAKLNRHHREVMQNGTSASTEPI